MRRIKSKEQRLQHQVNKLEKDLEYCRGCLDVRDKYWVGVGRKKIEAEVLLKDLTEKNKKLREELNFFKTLKKQNLL